jgi:Phage integrase, N-terminal SAM-like domain
MRKTAGIYERNGRIRVTYDLGPDPLTGERRQCFETLPPGTTKAEARIWRARKIADIANGIRPDPKQLTLRDYLNDWIERFRLDHPETRTWYSWRSYLTKHLLPLIGDVKMSRLDTAVIGPSLFEDVGEDGSLRSSRLASGARGCG